MLARTFFNMNKEETSMHMKKNFYSLIATLAFAAMPLTSSYAKPGANHQPIHFRKIMVVMFENMSYVEIKNEPTFKKLVEYTGNTLDENGRMLKMLKVGPAYDTNGNGYAFFSSYFNNHSGGSFPTRPSQPNYIAMTSGSVHGIIDNEIHNLKVDNLALELNEANINWKVYAEDLPDPTHAYLGGAEEMNTTISAHKPFVRDPNKSEEENDLAEQQYFAAFKHKQASSVSGCFEGDSHVDGPGSPDDGYKRKHEPFISYVSIQQNHESCERIMNASHLLQDIDNMADVNFYIPNQIHDGHNGTLEERVVNANAFLSKMMGTDPKTGEPLPDSAKAPFQKFMAQGGLLVLTFDEPSTTGNPARSVYTLLAGNMLNSSAYPDRSGTKTPV